MHRFACLEAVEGLWGHKSGPKGVTLRVLGKPTSPLDRLICGQREGFGVRPIQFQSEVAYDCPR